MGGVLPQIRGSTLDADHPLRGSIFHADLHHDPLPVVRLFTPDGNATWLLASLDPECPDVAEGL